jgi:ribonuclease R
MLPEELSADICSLKAGEPRAALACHLKIGRDGTIAGWRFTRAKICVAANIAYEDAQAAMDAAEEDRVELSSPTCFMPAVEGPVPQALVERALKPLWGCWRALFAARQKRDPLELDLPERRVMLDEKGRITSIAPRDRLDAHRLVEDYMIAANVAAARALEAKKSPVMYRVHEPPSRRSGTRSRCCGVATRRSAAAARAATRWSSTSPSGRCCSSPTARSTASSCPSASNRTA